MSVNITKHINLDYIIHLDHDCEEDDCPCENDNAIECEEEDCEACHRGKFCDCENKGCPHCNKDEDEETTCGVCKTETTMDATVGCCVNEGKCGTNNMCADCGKYDEDTDEWTCNKCLKPTIVYTGVRRKRILPPIKIL